MVLESCRDHQGSAVSNPGRVAARTLLRWTAVCPNPRRGRDRRSAARSPRAPPPSPKLPTPRSTAAKANGTGSARTGPVDPRTEDPSSPNGLSRAGKTLWRRPGALTPRTTKHHEVGPDAPIDFSVAMPLAPVAPDPPAARVGTAVPELLIAAEPAALAPTVEAAPRAGQRLANGPRSNRARPHPAGADGGAARARCHGERPDPVRPGGDDRRRHPDRPGARRRARCCGRSSSAVHPSHASAGSPESCATSTRGACSRSPWCSTCSSTRWPWSPACCCGRWPMRPAPIDNVEKFFEGFGWETFKFNGGADLPQRLDRRPLRRRRPHRPGGLDGDAVQPDHRPGRRHPPQRAGGGGAQPRRTGHRRPRLRPPQRPNPSRPACRTSRCPCRRK